MTPAMYIVTVICVTIVFISAMIFLPNNDNNEKNKDENRKDDE